MNEGNGAKDYIVEEQYQAKYKEPCRYTGKPCPEHLCPHWRVEMGAVPTPGLVAPPQPKLIGKCQDDWLYDNLKLLTLNVQQAFMMMMSGGPGRGGGPRGGLIPPGLG